MSEPTNRARYANAINRRRFLGGLLAGIWALLSQPLTEAFGGATLSQGGANPQLKAQRLSWAGVKLELPSIILFIDPSIKNERS